MFTAIGLMSGTSIDGIDAAVVRTDGHSRVEPGPAVTIPYQPAFRDRLRRCLGQDHAPPALEADLADLHAEAVRSLLAQAGLAPAAVDLIGFHGQTILHRPERRQTIQIGDAGRLAASTGIAVVAALRVADVLAGGQGAPLVPLYHQARAAGLDRPLAVLNLGGVGNVTWIGADDALLAFDTGPANALIDDWVLATTGRPFDDGGGLAAGGRIDQSRLTTWLADPFFDRPPPKSLDRNHFAGVTAAGLAPADGAATLAAFTAGSVVRAVAHLPAPPRRWLVTGGGRHNRVLMDHLAQALGVPVEPVETVGWRGDVLEAEAFGYLAVRSRLGLPITVPGTTGVPTPLTGGQLFLP